MKSTLALAIVTAMVITGCNPAMLKSDASQPPQIVLAILEGPKTFNPVISQDKTSSDVGGMIFAGLTEQDPFTGEIKPSLAKSWSISADKLRIVFTLKENLKWSDGHPLTADDVDFTYNQLYFNEAIPTGMRDVLRIGQSRALPKVRKLNDLQIEFTLPEPFAPFLGTTGTGILPAHILKETVEKKDKDGNLLFLSTWSVDTPPGKIPASGPYKIRNYTTSERVVFERNPSYWKKEAGNQLPYIDRVVWEIVESTDTFLLQFRSGGLDSVFVYPEYFSLLKKEEDRGNFTIYNGGPNYGTTFILFNLNTGSRNGKPLVNPIKSRWFNNLKFRKAIAYGIDRQRMVNNIYRGLGEPQTSFVSVQSPFYYDGLKGYDYDPEKARQLLKQAGFKYNNKQQLLDDRGNRVSFTLTTNSGNKIREGMGSQIAGDLGKIGIQVNFSPIAFNVLTNKLSNSLEWECVLLGFTGGNEPNSGANIWNPDGSLHMFNQKPKPGQTPLQGRKVDPWEEEIGQLFIKGARELDPEKRKAIYAEIQTLVEEKVPFIYLVNPLALGAVRNNIQTIEYSALGGAFWNLEELKITE
ncbi:MAG: ABC transporter substrate-binding protein [Xenococcaceae cyanobacterium MO_188.B32]|nr:ABC transporter substrate-binding protein [Xenococcaceae cyanobacterium MO_188.B32]